jgi:hypothetical protein
LFDGARQFGQIGRPRRQAGSLPPAGHGLGHRALHRVRQPIL